VLRRATLRLHAVSLAVASWLTVAWLHAVPGMLDRFGTLRGVDFLQFYAAGWVVNRGQSARLYDWDAFATRLPALVPGIGDLLYLPVYPPQLALALSPLAALPYLQALAIWTLLSVMFYACAVWAGLRALPALRPYRLETWAFALGFTPFVQLLAHGQVTTLAMPLLVAALAAFQAGRPVLVGIAFGSLVFKPQLGAFAVAALLLWPSWRLLAGLAVGAGLQLALVAATLGPALLWDYYGVIQRLAVSAGAFEPKIWAMHSLRGFFELLIGRTPLATASWLLSAGAVVWLARRAWRRQGSPAVKYALICVLGLLLNPHLYVYDLVLMAVPLACLAAWLIGQRGQRDLRVQWLTYALVWLPLLGPLAAVTRVQLTSLALVGLLWLLAAERVGVVDES